MSEKPATVRIEGKGMAISVDPETNLRWLREEVEACREAEREIRDDAEREIADIAKERERYESEAKEAEEAMKADERTR